jgi:1-acyl-sn-glycerol-3-phosphate acyltransferase
MKPFYRLCHSILYVFLKFYCRLKTYGVENVPKEGGVIIASNHIGAGDPPFVGGGINRESYFLAKKELFKNFLLGALIKNLNAIPVDRSILDQRALEQAERALKSGKALILFPEGTRSKTGEIGKGKPGVGLLARRMVVPVVPAHIENSRGFMKLPFSGRRLIIKYGPALDAKWIESLPDNKEGYRKIAEELMIRIRALA